MKSRDTEKALAYCEGDSYAKQIFKRGADCVYVCRRLCTGCICSGAV